MSKEIADRGIKINIKDCLNDKKKLMMLSFLLTISNIGLIAYNMIFQSMTKYFVVDQNKNVERLKQISKNFSLTPTAVYSYVEDSIILTFSLSYDTYVQQLERVKSRYNDQTFKQLLEELKRSNFISLMKKYHRTYTVIPTPTVYKIVPLGNNMYDVYRSFYITSIGDDGINRTEVIYVVRLKVVKKSSRYYNGLEIINVHEISLSQYNQIEKNLINNGGK